MDAKLMHAAGLRAQLHQRAAGSRRQGAIAAERGLGVGVVGGALTLAGQPVPRLMLHAAALEFPHPNGERARIAAPPPADFDAVLQALEITL